MRSILRSKNKLRKTKSANKIITNKREVEKAKEIEVETRKTKVKAKITRKNIETNAKANATTTTITTTTTTTTTTINKKYLLKLRKQLVYTYVSLALKIASILLNYLLLFNNL